MEDKRDLEGERRSLAREGRRSEERNAIEREREKKIEMMKERGCEKDM